MLSHCLDGLCPRLYSFNLLDLLHWSGLKFYPCKFLSTFLFTLAICSTPVKQGSCYARKLLLQMQGLGQEVGREETPSHMEVHISLLACVCVE